MGAMEPLTWLGRLLRTGSMVTLAACAALPERPPDTTSVAVGVPFSSTPPLGPFPAANQQTGMALRWQMDPNKCIGRPNVVPTPNEVLLLQNCSNSNQQAWTLANGLLAADSNLCAAYSGNANQLWLRPCDEGNMAMWAYNGGATFDFQTFAARGTWTFLCADSAAPAQGASVMALSPQGIPQDLTCSWHLTGVGTSAGSLMSLDGDANACLRHEAGELKVRPCVGTDANQRWSMWRGDLANSDNSCVVASAGLQNLMLIPCANVSNASDNNQGWTFGLVAAYMTFDGNGTTLTLTRKLAGDANAVELSPRNAAPRPRHWYVGNYRTEGSP